MSSLQDENQILKCLDLEQQKRSIDERMISNGKLCDDSIANGKNFDEEDYSAACQELLQKRSDIKTKIEALLETREPFCEVFRTLNKDEQTLVQTQQQTNPIKMVPHYKRNRRRANKLKLTTQMEAKCQETGLDYCK